MEYGRIMGHFKKALNYSIEENDQKNLNNLILPYIANKENQHAEGYQTSDDIETNKAGTNKRQQINVGYEKNEKNNIGI
ncbi:hypothetical protein C1646_774863 [Rhizophagus diaphanus]|nr:hypothetical protein C1646_774863 [Rhizophagus diaphanus] [Rhizophagus sp. MUCL 43196]